MKPYLILLVGVLSVSFAAIFIRLADAPPLVIAAYRLSIASVILIPITSVKSIKGLKKLSRNDVFLIPLSSIFIALHFGLWITSLSYTSIASSVVLVTSHPAFVAVISYFLWGERLNKLTISGIVVAMFGVIFINYGGFTSASRTFEGDLLALMAGFSMGAYLLIGGQLRKRIDILPYLTIIYTCSAVILMIVTLLLGYSLTGYSTNTYIMLV
ncbi:MAG: DMT family transporter, partial [Dehalococcoidales bacterium]